MASTALSKQRQAAKAKLKLEEAQEDVKALKEDLEELEAELQEDVGDIRSQWEEALTALEDYEVRPRRKDVQINLFGLAWTPHWRITYRDLGGVAVTELVEAF
jgi:chromosome segregation ATPase